MIHSKKFLNYLPAYWKSVALCLIFLAPVVASVVAYVFRDHFSFKISPHGHLLSPPIEAKQFDFFNSSVGKWQLIYFQPKACLKECQYKMYLLNNVRIALAKNSAHLQFSAQKPQNTMPYFAEDAIIVIDPKGWIILHYSPAHFQANEILRDLRRLLRFSSNG